MFLISDIQFILPLRILSVSLWSMPPPTKVTQRVAPPPDPSTENGPPPPSTENGPDHAAANSVAVDSTTPPPKEDRFAVRLRNQRKPFQNSGVAIIPDRAQPERHRLLVEKIDKLVFLATKFRSITSDSARDFFNVHNQSTSPEQRQAIRLGLVSKWVNRNGAQCRSPMATGACFQDIHCTPVL